MLLHVPNILGRDELARMRAALEAADWTDGRETVGVQGARVKRNEQLPEASPLRAELARMVLDALGQAGAHQRFLVRRQTDASCVVDEALKLIELLLADLRQAWHPFSS